MPDDLDARRPALTNTYDLDFFDHIHPSSAYWAGFLAADGCVRATRATVSLRLQPSDAQHIEKFCAAVNYSSHVRITDQAASVHINGPRWVAALDRLYGIRPGKSLTYRLPQLPPEALPHFVRGLVDGDGSITRTTLPSLHIVGTREVVTALAEIAHDHCGVRLKSGNRVPPVGMHSNGVTGQVSWSGRNAGRVLAWLYADSTDATRLTRKYEKYRQMWPIKPDRALVAS